MGDSVLSIEDKNDEVNGNSKEGVNANANSGGFIKEQGLHSWTQDHTC